MTAVPHIGTTPVYATQGAAGADLRAAHDAQVWPNEVTFVDTGLAVALPENTALMIYARSGHAKHGVALANGVGVVDSDYRGTIKVALIKHTGEEPFIVRKGDRIAQAVLTPVLRATFTPGPLPSTERGTGGFGSTGVA